MHFYWYFPDPGLALASKKISGSAAQLVRCPTVNQIVETSYLTCARLRVGVLVDIKTCRPSRYNHMIEIDVTP